MHFLTMHELLRLGDALRRPEYGLLVRFAGLTGLRAGEIGALRIGRLDLLRRRVDVLETASEVTGHGLVYGSPKTYERRSVPIPPALADELGAALVGRSGDADAFVFTLNATRSPTLTLMSAANPSIVALPRPSGRSHSLCALPGFEFSHAIGLAGVAHGSEAAETILVNG